MCKGFWGKFYLYYSLVDGQVYLLFCILYFFVKSKMNMYLVSFFNYLKKLFLIEQLKENYLFIYKV